MRFRYVIKPSNDNTEPKLVAVDPTDIRKIVFGCEGIPEAAHQSRVAISDLNFPRNALVITILGGDANPYWLLVSCEPGREDMNGWSLMIQNEQDASEAMRISSRVRHVELIEGDQIKLMCMLNGREITMLECWRCDDLPRLRPSVPPGGAHKATPDNLYALQVRDACDRVSSALFPNGGPSAWHVRGKVMALAWAQFNAGTIFFDDAPAIRDIPRERFKEIVGQCTKRDLAIENRDFGRQRIASYLPGLSTGVRDSLQALVEGNQAISHWWDVMGWLKNHDVFPTDALEWAGSELVALAARIRLESQEYEAQL